MSLNDNGIRHIFANHHDGVKVSQLTVDPYTLVFMRLGFMFNGEVIAYALKALAEEFAPLELVGE